MGWRIVYIEKAMDLRLYLDNLKITDEKGSITIPLNDIHSLIIDNTQAKMTIPLILKCSEYNINLVICNIEHLPTTVINPISGNYKTYSQLTKQINWDQNLKRILHKEVVKNKINNQIDLLKKIDANYDVINKLYEFVDEVEDGDVTNREGLAAKMYFRELFSPDFKRFSNDVINAGLNYGYSILRSQISKTIIAKGLHPALGIFHKGPLNQYNLSDDLIEPLRPLIDNYVYNNLRDAIIFKRDHRLDLIKITTKDVYINSTKQSMFNAISILVDGIIKFFETADIENYSQINLLYEL